MGLFHLEMDHKSSLSLPEIRFIQMYKFKEIPLSYESQILEKGSSFEVYITISSCDGLVSLIHLA